MLTCLKVKSGEHLGDGGAVKQINLLIVYLSFAEAIKHLHVKRCDRMS